MTDRTERVEDRIEAILATTPLSPEQGAVIGRSRERRPVRALRLGSGPVRVSLVGGCHADALRVQVAAPPADGLANAACVEALAEALDVRRSAVSLDPGSRHRRKRVRVDGDPAGLAARLVQLAGEGASA